MTTGGTMHETDCCEGTMTRAWHHAYCAWYDQREAGHKIRAAILGWVADRLCHYA